MESNKLTHLDKQNNPTMVDVSAKQVTQRTATARSIVVLPEEVVQQLVDGDIQTKKGAVFQTAIIAGIMAAKKTGDLIPLCHPLGMDNCQVYIKLHADNEVIIEALVGASIAALTVYDMCKAMSHDIVIKETKLISKTGGKRDFKRT
jgi:cyclic pyranopterin phosphate synthase